MISAASDNQLNLTQSEALSSHPPSCVVQDVKHDIIQISAPSLCSDGKHQKG